ncbi:Rubredoxin-NAD(+) reductase [Entamoeba marina]
METNYQCDVCSNVQKASNTCDACGASSLTCVSNICPVTKSTSSTDIVLIGGGAASISAIRTLLERKAGKITLICREPTLPYYRTTLPKIIVDEKYKEKDQFVLQKQEWYDENLVTLLTGCEVRNIDTKDKTIFYFDSSSEGLKLLTYEKLVLATGGTSREPPFIPSTMQERIIPIRSLEHMEKIVVRMKQNLVTKVVIIGGGLSGMEVSASLKRKLPNVEMTIVEVAPRILPRQLTTEASDAFLRVLTEQKISVELDAKIKGIEEIDSQFMKVIFENGKEIVCDLICHSCGVQCSVGLAKMVGCEVNRGIIVNDCMETSVNGVYAAGDCTEFNGCCFCSWSDALKQGNVAALSIAGEKVQYQHSPMPYFMFCFTMIFSIGDITKEKRTKIVGNDLLQIIVDNNKMVGGVIVGKPTAKCQKEFVKALDENLSGEELDKAFEKWCSYF